MKPILTLLLSLTLCLSLTGQSDLFKVGGTYRNSNYLTHTGNQKVGLQLGYSHPVSERWTLAVNLGSVTNHWEVERSNILVIKEKERNNYVEAMILFPLLQHRISEDKLKIGIGYVGSRNTFDYAEMAVVNNQELESMDAKSLIYHLHELGVMLEYTYPITDHIVAYGSSNFSASLNRAPAYQSTIITSGGGSSTLSSIDERNVMHYRISVGLGYMF